MKRTKYEMVNHKNCAIQISLEDEEQLKPLKTRQSVLQSRV